MKIRNPRTGIYDYEIPDLSDEVVEHRCAALRMHQTEWKKSGVENRIGVLQEWKAAVMEKRGDLIEALSIDTGRAWETVLEADIVAASIDRWCGIARNFFSGEAKKDSSIPFIKLQQALVPFELIGVISPWNFPLLLSLIDTIPALLAGSSVIVKPSEVTPRFIEVINKTIDAVPRLSNVLSYIPGDGRVGTALVNNCDLICFTGSTATGQKVYDAASKRMIPVFLELGGKDPAIVLEGANLEYAADSIVWGSVANAGQSCLSIERVYVQDTIYDAFTQLLVKKAESFILNADNIHHGEIGPIIFEKQVAIINDHLRDAVEQGAEILTGSTKCEEINGGYYCRPTVVVNVTHNMKLMQEETFGPIIPVMPFETKEEAITLANGTVYGLSGAVFAATVEEAMEVGSRIDGGAISINDAALTAIMHEGEKNSFKLSGIGGTRMGPSAIKRFMRQKVFIIKEQPIVSPWTVARYRV
ncbi:MAG: aldehyde dehydrogenase family protein [Chitinophagaceae bacterium]|nr:aldehyde dehydrogenase family protein [Chitinophagaceae bacterium]